VINRVESRNGASFFSPAITSARVKSGVAAASVSEASQ
jgi:hypothetical protein